jgi:hypothetical protein
LVINDSGDQSAIEKTKTKKHQTLHSLYLKNAVHSRLDERQHMEYAENIRKQAVKLILITTTPGGRMQNGFSLRARGIVVSENAHSGVQSFYHARRAYRSIPNSSCQKLNNQKKCSYHLSSVYY